MANEENDIISKLNDIANILKDHSDKLKVIPQLQEKINLFSSLLESNKVNTDPNPDSGSKPKSKSKSKHKSKTDPDPDSDSDSGSKPKSKSKSKSKTDPDPDSKPKEKKSKTKAGKKKKVVDSDSDRDSDVGETKEAYKPPSLAAWISDKYVKDSDIFNEVIPNKYFLDVEASDEYKKSVKKMGANEKAIDRYTIAAVYESVVNAIDKVVLDKLNRMHKEMNV